MNRLSCFIFFSILLFIILSHRVYSQLLNPGFEAWIGGEPVSWFTSNHPEVDPGSVNVTRSTNSWEGEYAVRAEIVTAVATDTVFPGPFDHIPRLTNASDDSATYTKGFPIAGRPKQLRGYWMYQPVGEVGFFNVNVYLFKEGALVGYGGRSRFAISFDTAYKQFIAPISYVSEEYPDTINIAFGIATGELGTVFYVDDLSLTFLEVLHPTADTCVVAGERFNIKWDIAYGQVDIYYSLDGGSTYQSIESGYPTDSTHYYWDVPPNLLATHALIKLVNSADPSEIALSDTFHIKPWQLSRIDNSGEFELFEPGEDGWSLSNSAANAWPQSWWQQFDYQMGIDPNTGSMYPGIAPFTTANGSDYPDWPLFVDVFGIPQCYLGTSSPPATHRRRAVNKWGWLKNTWRGSCEGFAVSSLLSFYRQDELRSRFPGIGSHDNLFTVGASTDARAAISQYYTHQFGKPFSTYEQFRLNTVDARQTLQELKDMFCQNNIDARPFGFYNNNGSGGHAVTAYKLERDADPTKFTVRVYDSNNPALTNRGIRIDSAANTWMELTGLGWGSGTTGALLGLPAGQHFDTVGLSLVPGAQPRAGVSLFGGASDLEIYNTSGAAITIKTSSGDSIGYADSLSFGNLAGGSPIIPKTGSFHPPIGYVVPVDEYSLVLSQIPDSMGYIGFLTDSLVYYYHREDFQGGQRDMLTYSGGVGMMNPDASSKSITVETIISLDSTERIFIISDLAMSQGDSVRIDEVDREALLTKNFGGATQYDLEVIFASGAGTDRFFHASVPLGTGSSHQIAPDWGDVESGPMKILIDAGNDGSIDDSIFVTNQLTGVQDRIATGIPAEYGLGGNYPNPFNPVTTISFDLPELSIVSLKVYNLVGEEVATLVDGARQGGSYRVTFDGSDLPSGVYLYRLKAGNFAAGGKMVLMK